MPPPRLQPDAQGWAPQRQADVPFGDCKYRCAPDGSRHFYSSEIIDRALAMHSEGASVAVDRQGDGDKGRDDTPLG